MRKAIKVVSIVVVLAALAGGYYLWRISPRIPERPFSKPSGPYPVGTREFDWTDSARPELYTKDPADHRRIVVQVWYPAAGGGDTALYLRRPGEFASSAGARAARKARTNSVLDAPVAAGEGAGWPVLIYNHGGAWTR